MNEKDWKRRSESYRKNYMDQMIKDVDSHNDKLEASLGKTRENDIDVMTKDARKAFVNSVNFLLSKSSAGLHWYYRFVQDVKAFFWSLKRKRDLKKGVYSNKLRLINGKWEYMK